MKADRPIDAMANAVCTTEQAVQAMAE